MSGTESLEEDPKAQEFNEKDSFKDMISEESVPSVEPEGARSFEKTNNEEMKASEQLAKSGERS